MKSLHTMRRGLMLAVHLTCMAPAAVRAQAPAEAPASLEGSPLTGLGDSVVASFTGWRLALHLGGVAATAGLAASGVDARVHNHFLRRDGLDAPSAPVIYGAFFAPLALGGALASHAWLAGSQPEWTAASAALQALGLAGAYQLVLKTVSGRAPPAPAAYADDGPGRAFRPGFLRGGIDYGWPSGLLLTNAAVVTALWRVLPPGRALRAAGVAYLALVAAATLPHDRAGFDWLSDTVAGTLMGIGIGAGVGQTFASRELQGAHAVAVRPMVGARRGVTFSVAF